MISQIAMPPFASPNRLGRLVVGGLGLICFALTTLLPASASENSIDDLPQAVIDALEGVVPGLVFTEIEIEEEDDGTEYEIHGIWNHREVEAELNQFGEFLELEIGDEEDDDGDDGDDDDGDGGLPDPVDDTLEQLFDDPTVLSSETVTAGGLEFIEIAAQVDGRDTQIRITPSGQLLAVETSSLSADPEDGTHVSGDDLPSAVLATAGDLAITTAIQIDIVGEPSVFFIDGLQGKARIRMLIAEAGELLSYELDRDADGISDVGEGDTGTSFDLWDTDGDHFPDGFEISKGTDPLDPDSFPLIISIVSSGGENVLIITVQTFRGADFQLQQCGSTAGDWQALGGKLAGDGLLHEIVVPIAEEIRRCFFRIKITPNPEEGDDQGGNSSTYEENCDLPTSLAGREISIGEDDEGETKFLCFNSSSRGEVVEREGGEVEISPFAYSFTRSGECELRVTLTFPTSDGFETEVFTLTFTSDDSGVYVSQEFEDGEPEDPEEGDFRLSAN